MFVTKYQKSSPQQSDTVIPATTQASLTCVTKGLGEPSNTPWQLLEEEISLPVAVIYQQKIDNNLAWMQRFADHYQVKLAPHGKTTMTPALFQQQRDAGAWAITLATAPQVMAAYLNGIKRIIMANQLIGKQNMQLIANVIADPDVEFYCLVDSAAQVKQLDTFFANKAKPLNVLIEVGVDGGRCGCRNNEQIWQLAAQIQQSPWLSLAGLEFYEGVIQSEQPEQAIRAFINNAIDVLQQLEEQGLISSSNPIITGAGSAWYDVVASTFAQANLPRHWLAVIRPGCYLIHDTGIYLAAQDAVINRNPIACDIGGDLQSSLEVWAYVQSVPEPGLAVIGMGKRDVAFDAGLPTPEQHFRPNWRQAKPDALPKQAPNSWRVTAVMDQHAYLTCPLDADIEVGDMIGFSSSHPCLTFDKWKHIAVINDKYQVTQLLSTYF
ncbi:amino acid deaminase [Motilimonas sp. KMU-193]|uniref:amino acid deaminase n=1 Tax=Motilimonas sp. KMU-193 TaxID=3388668 RepID=UPI00396B3ADF